MSVITPGGFLLGLPREIRDEIYGYCFGTSYIVLQTYYWKGQDKEDCKNTNLAILRTSKAINADAKHFLFSKAASKATTFKYRIDFDPCEGFSTPPAKEDTTRMMHVEFDLRQDCERWRAGKDGYQDDGQDESYPVHRMDPLCEASIDHFMGTDVIRDDLRIKLDIDYFDCFENSIVPFIMTRFFQTLKRLNGFQRLTLVFEWDFFYALTDMQELNKQNVIKAVRKELEPHLGRAVIKSVNFPVSRIVLTLENYFLEMKFQPHRFFVEDS